MAANEVTLTCISNVKTLLEDYEWSRADLAREMECSGAYVTQLLSGDYNVSLNVWERVAAALQVDVTLLVYGLEGKDAS